MNVKRIAFHRWAALLTLVALLGAGFPQDAHAGFWDVCVRLFKVVTADSQFTQDRAKAYLPGVVEANRQIWLDRLKKRPEEWSGLTTEEALASLQTLNTNGYSTWGVGAVRNATYFIPVPRGTAVVKDSAQRTNIDGDKVVSFYNYPRYEVMAFILDRYLGTNLVPPAVMLKGGSSASFKVRGGAISVSGAESSPANFMDISHMRILDILMANGDRNFPGNLLQGPDGRPVAIDFDLSKPFYPSFGYGGASHYYIESTVVDSSVRLGKKGPLPGVISKEVYDRLLDLDEKKILEIAKEGGMTLTRNEIDSILSGRASVRASVQRWEGIYGSSNILIK